MRAWVVVVVAVAVAGCGGTDEPRESCNRYCVARELMVCRWTELCDPEAYEADCESAENLAAKCDGEIEPATDGEYFACRGTILRPEACAPADLVEGIAAFDECAHVENGCDP